MLASWYLKPVSYLRWLNFWRRLRCNNVHVPGLLCACSFDTWVDHAIWTLCQVSNHHTVFKELGPTLASRLACRLAGWQAGRRNDSARGPRGVELLLLVVKKGLLDTSCVCVREAASTRQIQMSDLPFRDVKLSLLKRRKKRYRITKLSFRRQE